MNTSTTHDTPRATERPSVKRPVWWWLRCASLGYWGVAASQLAAVSAPEIATNAQDARFITIVSTQELKLLTILVVEPIVC